MAAGKTTHPIHNPGVFFGPAGRQNSGLFRARKLGPENGHGNWVRKTLNFFRVRKRYPENFPGTKNLLGIFFRARKCYPENFPGTEMLPGKCFRNATRKIFPDTETLPGKIPGAKMLVGKFQV